ncbi:alpha/beta hydrolase [Microbacterium protaetiae]|uniref:Alpha/beta hydrolase n=1 Tax=Microbacterium protaetiae TaxID=2509458 RepID=A0A4P6EA76_9MICO|nr:alpha/beta hydrolase [Microbacterium protaetiae]QAY58874.1 alpha/beta hydrolase [Microbacterium protaetiae]
MSDYERVPPVPYDPELLVGMEMMRQVFEPMPLRADTIVASREHVDRIIGTDLAPMAGDAPVRIEEVSIPGPSHDDPEIVLTIVRPKDPVHGASGLYAIHGGGMVLGNRFMAAGALIPLVLEFGAVGVSVEYRLAPENPWPSGVEDCYAGLVWFSAHAADLGVDAERILVMGSSAGGGLSAAVSLLARERGGPKLVGQLLDAPMIDDRNTSVSTRQYDLIGVWDRNNNDTGWKALLGEDAGTDRVHWSAAPNRMEDLSDLPPAFIEVGAAEVFRVEAVEYASRIWAAGGQAELHVWSGAHHGFSGFSPEAIVSRAANDARMSWLRRILA